MHTRIPLVPALRNIDRLLFVSIPFFLLSAVFAKSGASPRPSAASAQASGAQFRVVRSVSGSTGREVDGRYVVDDPRTVFTAGKDQKVIVYFEWEGPPGPHHFEGLWKNPEGKIVLLSDFRYEATKSNFSGYWTLLLPESPQLGEWALEARIDGESAGVHSFVVSSAPGAVNVGPTRHVLSMAEIYQQALSSSLVVEKLASDGTLLGRSSGFWVGDGRVLTAFEAIDGASTLGLALADGSRQKTDQVLAWNRWQDWALLLVPSAKGAILKRAEPASWKVGERCAFLETGTQGERVITDGTIIGTSSFPHAGDRLNIVSFVSLYSVGSALLNEYGEYVAVVGGSTVPGADAHTTLELTSQNPNLQQGAGGIKGGMAVPASLIPEPPQGTAATSLQELWRRQQFIPPLIKAGNLKFATLTSAIEKGHAGMPAWPLDYRQVFSRRDTRVAAFANWQPVTKQKGVAALRVYDLENQILTESKPSKLDLKPGAFVTSSWELPLSTLPPGIYRAEILVDSNPVWRTFFRVTE